MTNFAAVVLDGTVIHKTGLITGGVAIGGKRRNFDELGYDALQQRSESLVEKIEEASIEKRRLNEEEELRLSLQETEQALNSSREEIVSIFFFNIC